MTNPTKSSETIAKQGVIVGIICAALVFGVVTFSILVAIMVGPQNITSSLGALTIAGMLVGIISSVIAFLIAKQSFVRVVESIRGEKRSLDATGAQDEIRERLSTALVTGTILQYAIIETGIFANLICFFLEKSAWSLVMAAVGILLMLVSFPFPGRMSSWISEGVSDLTGKFQG